MQDTIVRFLTFQVVTVHPIAYWGLGIVWLLLLMAAFTSVRSLAIGTFAKVLWFFFILLAPLIGLTFYTLRCLFLGDWSFLKPFLTKPKSANKLARN